MRKVIFLDIDGVLNSEEGFKRSHEAGIKDWNMLEPELVERFNRLVEETGADVVLSSTWRLDPDWHEVMLKGGLKCTFLGRTPRMPRPFGTSHEYAERGKEILEWLSINPYGVTTYAIIDDDPDFLPEQPLFRTSFKTGLTEEICEAVKSHLSTVHNPIRPSRT